MPLTFIYDDRDGNSKPKPIDIKETSKRCPISDAAPTINRSKVKSTVMIYCHGGLRKQQNVHQSYLRLPNADGQWNKLNGAAIFSRLEAWFTGIPARTLESVTRIELLACHAADTDNSVALQLRNALSNNVTTGNNVLFPNVETVVGVRGVIDQDNNHQGINLTTYVHADLLPLAEQQQNPNGVTYQLGSSRILTDGGLQRVEDAAAVIQFNI